MTLTKKFLRRYSNLPSLIHLLTTKSLTFLDPQSWDDKNDSLYMRLYKEKKKLDTLLAVCFSQETETYHHWSVFAPGSSGVCISFRKEELLEVLNQWEGIHGRSVTYITLNALADTPKDVRKLPFMKRSPFKPEAEYRVIFEEKGKPRRYVNIDIPLSSIDRVTLSPWMPESVAESVKAALKGLGAEQTIKVFRSTLIDNDQWAEFGKSVVGEAESASDRLTKKK